jgi:uncharacterized protein
VCAPAVEELMFRGLLLRALMTRFGFWPAAIVSTGIFAAVHTYEVNTLVGAVTLAGAIERANQEVIGSPLAACTHA